MPLQFPMEEEMKILGYTDEHGFPHHPVRFPKDWRDNPKAHGMTPLVSLSLLEEALNALEPFARFADERALEGGDESLFYGTKDGRGVRNGDFKRARAVRNKIMEMK